MDRESMSAGRFSNRTAQTKAQTAVERLKRCFRLTACVRETTAKLTPIR